VVAYFGYLMNWWFISVIIGLLAFPLSFYLFRKSHDKGYMFSKIIGLFVIGYFSWLIGYINFSSVSIIFVILLMTAASAWVFINNKKEILDFMGEKFALVLITELFYLFIFLFYAFFKMYHPDILGQEKFMDFAFMNAVGKSDQMPPFDPWMSGRGMTISYYYFGYVMMGIILKLTAIPNGMAYNVALTYLYAISAIGVLGLMYNLTKNYVIGFLGFAMLLVLGNLDGVRQLFAGKFSLDNFNWWNSTRVMDYENYDYTITEFPFFSFLLGDMHPHQMAIPFVLLALNTALTFIKCEAKNLYEATIEKMSFLIFSGLVLGGLWFLNSWDFPTYFFVTALCILSYKYSREEKIETHFKDLGMALGIIFGVAIVAYLPFTATFKNQVKGIGLVNVNTKLSDYLLIFGVMLFPVLSFLVTRILNWIQAIKLQGAGSKSKKRELFCPRCSSQFREGKMICGQCGYIISGDELYLGGTELPVKKSNETTMSFFKFVIDPAGHKDNKVYLYSLIGIALALVLLVYKSVIDKTNMGLTTGLLTMVLGVVILLGFTKTEMKENQFVLILIFTALFATWGTEIFRVVDGFNDNIKLRRMNTIFKFYYQAWIMLSIAAAYSFFWVNHFYMKFKPKWMKYTWMAAFFLLLAGGFVYTIGGTKIRTNDFKNYMTLDGADFFKGFSYDGRMSAFGDYQAMDWIRKNIKGHPVILEAVGGSYTEYARIASFTGLQTIVGWPWHETQWRGTGDEAGRREADVREMYESTDINRTTELLKKYNVKYVYLGALERDKYAKSPEGLQKFNQMADIVYANKVDTFIYKIRE
jgi:YYY domain-containing protein